MGVHVQGHGQGASAAAGARNSPHSPPLGAQTAGNTFGSLRGHYRASVVGCLVSLCLLLARAHPTRLWSSLPMGATSSNCTLERYSEMYAVALQGDGTAGAPGSGRPVLFYVTTQAGRDIRTQGVRNFGRTLGHCFAPFACYAKPYAQHLAMPCCSQSNQTPSAPCSKAQAVGLMQYFDRARVRACRKSGRRSSNSTSAGALWWTACSRSTTLTPCSSS